MYVPLHTKVGKLGAAGASAVQAKDNGNKVSCALIPSLVGDSPRLPLNTSEPRDPRKNLSIVESLTMFLWINACS